MTFDFASVASARIVRRPRGVPVGKSKDLTRILELPRRVLELGSPDAAQRWTTALRRDRTDKCECVKRYGFCITSFLPIQGWALEEMSKASALLGPIGVGHGKEGICLMAAWAVGAKRAVLLLPSNLKAQFLQRDLPQWAEHFEVPSLAGGDFYAGRPVLHVISFAELSASSFESRLGRIAPDLIIANEVQNVGRKDAARTKRFLRYFDQNPTTRLVAVSGTISKKSIKDYAHLSWLSLREGSPLPHDWATVQEWATILDADAGDRAESYERDILAGELQRLCSGAEESPRAAFRRRLVETVGVVATEEGALDTELSLAERNPAIPRAVQAALEATRRDWQRPDGEELVDGIAVASVLRQLACGFYYKWRWVKGESVAAIEAWLDARANWHKEVRQRLKSATELMDSPFLVMQAAIRWHKGYVHVDHETGVRTEYAPHSRRGPLPTWDAEHWPLWRDIRKTCKPATEAVWVDPYVVEDAASWAQVNNGIVWYDFTCMGAAIAAQSGAPLYGGGSVASEKILGEDGSHSIIASITAHGTGKNLQRFSRNLIVNPPADGAAWEQLLARTHRPGQRADEVTAEVYRHTVEMRDAIDTAISRARYMQETLGQSQKLIYAGKDWV